MKKYIVIAMFILFSKGIIAQTINYNYDSLGRLTQVIYPDSSIIKYTYDATGNRISKAVIVIQSPIIRACPQSNISFFAGTNDNTKTYQWQVDTTAGFNNISNNAIYSGANTPTLSLTNVPSNWYGYKFRCLISDAVGTIFSRVTTMKFSTTWIGTSNIAWENISNWSCGLLPDENTDIIINSGAPFYPTVNTNVSCRSLTVNPSVTVTVTTGHTLNIKGH